MADSSERTNDIPADYSEQLKTQNSNTIFEQVFDCSEDIMFLLDKNKKIIKYNQKAKDYFGPSISKGKYCYELVHGTTSSPTSCTCTTIWAKKQSVRKEFYEPHFDKWFDLSSFPLLSDDNEIIAVSHSLRDISQNKELEFKLKESEELHRLTLSEISDAVFITDDEGNFRYICPNVHFIFGYSADAVIKMDNIQRLIGDNLFDLNKLQESKELNNIEWTVTSKSGIQHELLINVKYIDNRFGKILYCCRDISQRKAISVKLRNERERFYSALEIIPAFVYIQNEDYTIKYANKEFRRLFGAPEGKKCFELIANSTHPCTPCPTFKVFQNHTSQNWEWTNEQTGRTYMIYDNYLPDIDGTSTILEIGVDITDIKNAESSLRENQARLQLALYAAGAGTWIWDIETNKVTWDSKMLDIFNLKAEEFQGTFDNWKQCVHPNDLDSAEKAILHSINTGEHFECEYRIKGATNEEWRHVTAQAVVIKNSTGKAIRMAGLCIDITDRINSQERLLQNSKMATLGTLVSGIGHEINNPNTFIMLNAPLLRTIWENKFLPLLEQVNTTANTGLNLETAIKRYPKLIAGIEQGASRIKNIIKNLKDFARQGNSSLEEDININDVIQSSISLVHNKITHSTTNFKTIIESNLPNIKGNFQRLEQVIINLLINACDSLQNSQSEIELKTTYNSHKRSVAITIKDEGCGIPRDVVNHITDPFFTTKRDSGGTGLGLSICSGIIADHNGSLTFNSEEGKGTTVQLELPAYANQETSKD